MVQQDCLGGDEFALMMIGDETRSIELMETVRKEIAMYNAQGKNEFAIDMSVGCQLVLCTDELSIPMVLEKADKIMYEEKKKKGKARQKSKGQDHMRKEIDKFVEQRLVSVVPSKRQIAHQRREFYGFVHFTVNTFTGKEWGDGTEDEAIFNPVKMDADQWCDALCAAGMKGLILTCKHHDGFCLWPSRYTTLRQQQVHIVTEKAIL